jgi:hypothetical protein
VSGFLLDTNCISELVRPKPEPRVVDWMESADEALLYLSGRGFPRANGGHVWKPGWRLNCKRDSPDESYRLTPLLPIARA